MSSISLHTSKQHPFEIDQKNIPQDLVNVAQDIEKQFLEFLFKEMENSVEKTETSFANDYYSTLMRQERVQKFIDSKKNIGIKDMIIQAFLKNKG